MLAAALHLTSLCAESKSLSPSFANMVSAEGVLLTIEDRATSEDINAPVDYHLVARDGFNGIELWKRPMKQWSGWQTESIKSIPTQQQRCLAAVGRMVYACSGFGGPVAAFAIRTGAEGQVYAHTKRTTEFAIDGKALYVIKGTPCKLPRAAAADGRAELCALHLENGAVLWSQAIADEYTGGTFAVTGSGVVYHSASGLTCLDSASGEVFWREAVPIKAAPPVAEKTPAANRKKKKLSSPTLFFCNIHPTLVLTDDTVFCATDDSMTAKSLADGKTLWTAPAGNTDQRFQPDLQPIVSESVKTLHLLASPGFLNDSPQHRTYWTVDRDLRYGGAMGQFSSGPAGDTIAFDGKLFHEIRGYYAPGRNLPGRGRGLDQLELYFVSLKDGSIVCLSAKSSKQPLKENMTIELETTNEP